jgi:hypothetical protein
MNHIDIKKLFFALVMAVPLSISTCGEAEAAIPIAKIIQEGVKKVIKAVDLMIQRLQNKTIWLQNAQKVLENKLNELKLKEIAEWTDKHKKLYEEYYEELWKVKNAIETYDRIRHVMNRQLDIVELYKRSWSMIQSDEHFTKDEIKYMYKVYSGILQESIKGLDQMLSVVKSFDTQMTDGKRLEMISLAAETIEQNYFDLNQFNAQNIRLSLSRAKDEHEIQVVKKLYNVE